MLEGLIFLPLVTLISQFLQHCTLVLYKQTDSNISHVLKLQYVHEPLQYVSQSKTGVVGLSQHWHSFKQGYIFHSCKAQQCAKKKKKKESD